MSYSFRATALHFHGLSLSLLFSLVFFLHLWTKFPYFMLIFIVFISCLMLGIKLSFSMSYFSSWLAFCPKVSFHFFKSFSRAVQILILSSRQVGPKGLDFLFILSDLLSSLSDLDFELFWFCSNLTAYPVWIVYTQCFTLVLIH